MAEYSPGIILVEDSIEVNIRHVLKYIISKIQPIWLCIFCVENSPDKWSDLGKNMKFIHYENPKEWAKLTSKSLNIENSTVILDSVNQASALIGWQECLRLFNEISKNKCVKNFILILHTDCLLYGNKMTKQLRHISQTTISLSRSPSGLDQLEVKTKSQGGKIKQITEEVYYDNHGKKWVNSILHKNFKKSQPTSLPQEISSFKISIENSAKAVKDGLVLPYTELTRESRVVYHHDAADDWDEEDPDEDLDI